MPACCRNLKTTLGSFLTDNIRKINLQFSFSLPYGCASLDPICTAVPYQIVRKHIIPGEYRQDILQGSYSKNVKILKVNCFQRRFFRKYYTLESIAFGKFSTRQGPRNSPNAPIQSEFSEYQILFYVRKLHLPRCGNDADGNGDIIQTAVLSQVGRSHIYNNSFARYAISECHKRRHCPQETFLHRHVGKPDQMYAYAEIHVSFNRNADCLYANAFCRIYSNKHNLIVRN